MTPALFGQESGRTAPLMAEVKIKPDGRAPDAEPADQGARDEFLGSLRRERGIECQHQCPAQPGCRKQPQLLRFAGEAEDRIAGAQHVARVRLECHRDRRRADRRCARLRRLDDGAVAAMHAVEIADRRDRAPEPGNHRGIVADDDERIRRF
jgi:hypothetical protein